MEIKKALQPVGCDDDFAGPCVGAIYPAWLVEEDDDDEEVSVMAADDFIAKAQTSAFGNS